MTKSDAVHTGCLAVASRGSVLYTLRELGRRAGATEEFVTAWRVTFDTDTVTLFPDPDRDVRIIFPFDRLKPSRWMQLHDASPSRYTWMRVPSSGLAEAIPDFIVPFEDLSSSGMPMFEAIDSQTVVCKADVLTSALWVLSRLEEFGACTRDEHGRFTASGAVAFRARYIERPIVDEYGFALEQAVSHVCPGWKPEPRQLRVKLSHDVDLVGLPRTVRSIIGHLYPRKMPSAFARDVISALGFGLPAYLQGVLEIAYLSRNLGFRSCFYWQASRRSPWDSGYDLKHPQIVDVMRRLGAEGFELGIHPGYNTFNSFERLQLEVSELRRIVCNRAIGGRQHYLRWHPKTWRAWESAGLAYDSTVGFADAIGFRAGTCIPYHPWLLEEDRESALLEIPLIVMDCTPIAYMGLNADAAIERISTLVARSTIVGGVFTLLWHNTGIIEPQYRKLYPRILGLLKRAAQYDWESDAAPKPTPRDVGAIPIS